MRAETFLFRLEILERRRRRRIVGKSPPTAAAIGLTDEARPKGARVNAIGDLDAAAVASGKLNPYEFARRVVAEIASERKQ